MTNVLSIYTDGGARGNPGPSAIGVVIIDKDNRVVEKFGTRIEITTNNRAEYRAVIEALRWIRKNLDTLDSYSKINFFLDSNLVCSQLNGLFKIKDSNLRDHLFSVRQLEGEIDIPIAYTYIPREKNKEADKLVNKALCTKE
ncbi:MAG: hypothetical protein A2958_01220 [Candidatus Levybacteria bacterium RIFCSPLOWO2_01_FULL_38_13]|nr:MAG: hypothetical protein A2629_01080 [Candidatus Levybacteria bacterium RIFCSPHIGHO2_01_FULL_41_15]OGH35775.1 MAG: hypothetical protein A2958_01220 [Candidatus Levybacteria bacterium RIFCSPLOWO2_01_FULL_38_13]